LWWRAGTDYIAYFIRAEHLCVQEMWEGMGLTKGGLTMAENKILKRICELTLEIEYEYRHNRKDTPVINKLRKEKSELMAKGWERKDDGRK
jgi:hypothetical protein